MSKKKYKRGRQICSMADFEQSKSKYFIVYFGSTNPQTKHIGFLASWQYRVLQRFINRGWVWEADSIDGKQETPVEQPEIKRLTPEEREAIPWDKIVYKLGEIPNGTDN